jgi:hypothetical protein
MTDQPQVLLTGLSFRESARWHEGRFGGLFGRLPSHLAACSLLVALTACSAPNTVLTAPPSTQATPAVSTKAAASAATCSPAPAWLVAAIEAGITRQTPGAMLTRAFVLAAGAVTGFPAAMDERLARGQLVAGTIAGGGASGQGVWVTDRTSSGASGTIIALNDVALMYSDWGAESEEPITVVGSSAALACAGAGS